MPSAPKPETAEQIAKSQRLYDKLKEIRESTTVSLKPTPLLKDTIRGLDGTEQPFKLRYYQVQGIYHMLVVPRMVLGDDTGLGKTIETIATFCYLWQKEPNNKVIVVAPKSAIRQWASEIKRFTNGVRPIIAGGDQRKGESPVEARERSYKEWLNAPPDEKVVLLMNYAVLVRDWDHGGFQPPKKNGKLKKEAVLPGLLDGITAQVGAENLAVVFDECFDYHTPVTLADGSNELIGKIVCKQQPVEVLSWNWAAGRVEPKRVVRWLRNPLKGGPNNQGNRKTLLKVTFKYARSCRVTKAHKFYRPDGTQVAAGLLRKGSQTAFLNQRAPSEDQLQIILGGLLGDASVSHPQRALWGVSFVQGAAQADYLEFKRAALQSIGVSATDITPSGYGGQPIHRFRLTANASVCSRFVIHDGKRKHLTTEWLDAIKPLGLAIWYGDDGSLSEHTCKDGSVSRQITLNTQGFTYAEQHLLVGWLQWRWGIKAEVKTSAKGHQWLYLKAESADRFLDLLPGALPGVAYKFPNKTVLQSLDTQPRCELVPDTVVSTSNWSKAPKRHESKEFVYDLEVEDNHNYFAGGTLVSNCTAFKSDITKTWEKARFLSDRSRRVYGLTATLLKNHLFEGYCIYKAIKPGVFTTKKAFYEAFCYVEMRKAGTARIPIIKGYKNLNDFRAAIDPVFLGRKKHAVAKELPVLTTREISFELNGAEEKKYQESLNGILELGDGEVKDFEEHKALTSLIYCQMIVNSLSMLKFAEGDEVAAGFAWDGDVHKVGSLSSKEQALVDLITGELDGEKVIIYTRFASLVPRLQALLQREGVKSVAVTGAVADKKRKAAQDAFQDLESDTAVIFITAAGSEAINLQVAKAMIFFDMPWSWGEYLQAIGRMIRIGSPNAGVLAFHLLALRPDRDDPKTIDHHVLKMLRSKKSIIDKVLGEGAVGALKFDKSGSTVKDLVKALQKKASS